MAALLRVLLNEFFRCVEDLLGAGYCLLRHSGCDALHALGNRLGALGHAGCCATDSLAARKGKLSSA